MENEVTGQSEDLLCPLCLEELDLTDRSFRPCKCGYQICLWCWYNINEKVNGKCPACRTPYSQEQVMQKSLDAEIVKAAREEKKRKKEKQKQKMEKTSIKAAFSTTSAATNALESVEMEKDLQNVRIMQRNLVYIVGLAPNITKEEVLKRKEYLGKFGKIVKIAVNRKLAQNNPHRPSCSAYVTFKREEDALECISALNGHTLDGRLIKATFGTTKYCSFFLRGISCNNPNCLYLHELAKEEDCFTKEDLSMAEKLDPFTSLHSSLDPAQMDLARQGAMEEFSSKLDQNSAGSVESQNPNSDGYDTQSSTKDERAIKNVIERSSLFSLDLAAVFSVKNPENSSFISLQGLPKSLSSSALDRFVISSSIQLSVIVY